ncbi:hypothetical protein DXG03_002816 [Asterophora parasitica]|uniref:UDP-galactose transporter homolog 1 n=1 Tax=Asterophora parasitica TaxID=117018 RepID=A0A9P7G1Y5_9AGAR|nr:hypothetical protein DXG03_002816 [Asterophora parasitica]
MTFVRLITCVGGVYSMFLLWAIAQERLSTPFKTLDGSRADKFKSPLFMGTLQSALSALSAFIYITLRRKPGTTIAQSLGLAPSPSPAPVPATTTTTTTTNGAATNGHSSSPTKPSKKDKHHHTPTHPLRPLLLHYLQCSLFITLAAPLGFAALSHITYPALVLGKSCKLVPVMLMNVLLYRRKFALHKYVVVGMVTAGITVFMWLGPRKSGHSKGNGNGGNQILGLTYLLLNLLLDGATNSTQDEIFSRYRHTSNPVTGQQMMFFINLFCTLITLSLSILPLPHIPVIRPGGDGGAEVWTALEFLRTHPGSWRALLQFAATGALGQLFIFETLQRFGSLTLVTITLTRKLFTMLLSVAVYGHKLTPGQWLGAAVVFAGISVEAFVKRKDVHAKRVIQEKEKAKIKSL